MQFYLDISVVKKTHVRTLVANFKKTPHRQNVNTASAKQDTQKQRIKYETKTEKQAIII